MSRTEYETIGEKVSEYVQMLLAFIFFAALIVGVPAYAVVQSWGKPLYGTRAVTTTTTEHYGILVETVPLLLLWGMLMFIGWAMATGRLPAMRRF